MGLTFLLAVTPIVNTFVFVFPGGSGVYARTLFDMFPGSAIAGLASNMAVWWGRSIYILICVSIIGVASLSRLRYRWILPFPLAIGGIWITALLVARRQYIDLRWSGLLVLIFFSLCCAVLGGMLRVSKPHKP